DTDTRFQDLYVTEPHFADPQFTDPSADPSVVGQSSTRLLQSVKQQINEVAQMTKAEKAAKESRQKDAENVLEQAKKMGVYRKKGADGWRGPS
ncbi:hypothetical protein Tco_1488950, partial [Tanacetum coccineum]